MIFEVQKEDKIYIVDDLKPFYQQTKQFQQAFNEVKESNTSNVITATFDNADTFLYTETNRVLISLKEIENENN